MLEMIEDLASKVEALEKKTRTLERCIVHNWLPPHKPTPKLPTFEEWYDGFVGWGFRDRKEISRKTWNYLMQHAEEYARQKKEGIGQ